MSRGKSAAALGAVGLVAGLMIGATVALIISAPNEENPIRSLEATVNHLKLFVIVLLVFALLGGVLLAA